VKTGIFIVKNRTGLHARPASLFVQRAAQFKCTIRVSRAGHFSDAKDVDGKSILGILGLGASKGTVLQVAADGPDEVEALNALDSLLINIIGEDE